MLKASFNLVCLYFQQFGNWLHVLQESQAS